MKLLFDQNISFRIVKKIDHAFPGSRHVSDCGLQDRADTEIWEYAKRNQFLIATFDADFFDISVINGHPPKIVWFRFGNTTTQNLANVLIQNKEFIQQFQLDSDGSSAACLEIA